MPADRTEQVERPRVTLPLAATLRAVLPGGKEQRASLHRGTCTVGSSAEADLVIADPKVSRRHVELALAPEGLQVTDLGSRNGTFYLDHRIERATLAFGSQLRVGDTVIYLEVDPKSLSAREGAGGPSEYRGLVTASPSMRDLFGTLDRLEGSLVNVLLQGESGVGKEVIARAIHDGSSVADKPFVALNCGALPRELVTSELFGHRRGAFTGANEARRGAFEQAHGGTLFLDEVGELPLDVQPMLLRALESGEVRVIGAESSQRVEVRVIAATNRQLGNEVRSGQFREDLYYRLAVVSLVVPSLRERPEDVPLLATHFARSMGMPPLDSATVAALEGRSWPGNVRELRNAIQAYGAIGRLPSSLGGGDEQELERLLSRLVDPERPYVDQKDEMITRFTRVYLETVMRRAGNNQTEAARLAQIDRGHFGRLLAKHRTR